MDHDTTVYEALNAALIRIQWAMANTLTNKAPVRDMLAQLAEADQNVKHAAAQLTSLAKEMREASASLDDPEARATIIDWADVIVEAEKEAEKADAKATR